MMSIIIDKNTNIEKEKYAITLLEQSIEQDMNNNDMKSLKYHTMALNEHKKVLSELENNYEMEI